jgi:hypothetical protein
VNADEELIRRPVLEPNLPASLAGGHALAFPAQRPKTVRSGGGERRVPLFTETWPVQVERKLYPAVTPNAFLVAELRSPSRQVMPGGEAQLFVGADPAGQARLTLVWPGEPFTLPRGVDAAVRPVRNVKLMTSEKGFIGKDELTEYLVTLEVANPYPFALPVRIHDQWPLSRSGDVEVKLVRTEPYAEQDKDKGTLTWRLRVPPSEKTVVSFLYTVRHPKGWRLGEGTLRAASQGVSVQLLVPELAQVPGNGTAVRLHVAREDEVLLLLEHRAQAAPGGVPRGQPRQRRSLSAAAGLRGHVPCLGLHRPAGAGAGA